MPLLRMTPAPGDEHSGLPSSSYQFATHRFASGSGVPAPRTRGRVGPVEQIHWERGQESLQVPDGLSARLR